MRDPRPASENGALAGVYRATGGAEGDGSGKAAQELTEALGLSERVHFTGLLTGTSLVQAYTDADMLVMLSHRENFGMVVVEAMAADTPALLARTVGLADEVQEYGAGRAVSTEPGEIVEAWRQMLANEGARREMGCKGRAMVRERYSHDAVATQMLALLAQVAGKRKSRS
jgi:glycosyltransferase involved in cell wall biosynthesis